MATTAEVRNQALQLLGVLRLGQDPQDQDKTNVETAYGEVYAYLKKEGLATWADGADVPTDLVPYVVALTALSRASLYGISNDRLQRIVMITGPTGDTAYREIRKITTPDYESLEEPTDF